MDWGTISISIAPVNPSASSRAYNAASAIFIGSQQFCERRSDGAAVMFRARSIDVVLIVIEGMSLLVAQSGQEGRGGNSDLGPGTLFVPPQGTKAGLVASLSIHEEKAGHHRKCTALRANDR